MTAHDLAHPGGEPFGLCPGPDGAEVLMAPMIQTANSASTSILATLRRADPS